MHACISIAGWKYFILQWQGKWISAYSPSVKQFLSTQNQHTVRKSSLAPTLWHLLYIQFLAANFSHVKKRSKAIFIPDTLAVMALNFAANWFTKQLFSAHSSPLNCKLDFLPCNLQFHVTLNEDILWIYVQVLYLYGFPHKSKSMSLLELPCNDFSPCKIGPKQYIIVISML